MTAQAQTAMAPPVAGGGGASASGQNVFQWQGRAHKNRQVPITRAVFDQGGYQLYDNTGETIVVPFANQNLYVMRFGQSSGGTYFVQRRQFHTDALHSARRLSGKCGSARGQMVSLPAELCLFRPGLCRPRAIVVGLCRHGLVSGHDLLRRGTTGNHPWSVGLSFSPLPGLYFSIFNHPYYGWNSYHSYYSYHPTRPGSYVPQLPDIQLLPRQSLRPDLLCESSVALSAATARITPPFHGVARAIFGGTSVPRTRSVTQAVRLAEPAPSAQPIA